MSEQGDQNAAVQALAGHLSTLLRVIEPIREGTLGYRNSLIEMGMSAPSADRCAADFHHWLIVNIMGKQEKAT